MSQFEVPVIPRIEDGEETSERINLTKRILLVVLAAVCVAGVGVVVLFDTMIDDYFEQMEARRAGDVSTETEF